MKKKIFGLVLTLAMTATLMVTSAGAVWDGTVDTDWYTNDESSDTFTISDEDDLAGLASLVNGGNTFSGKTITLDADLDLDNKEWTPIGTSNGWNEHDTSFMGTFDGDTYTISNLYIDDENLMGAGLFGQSGGTLKNVTIINAEINASSRVGALLGSGQTVTITDCEVTGDVKITGYYMLGGMVGSAYAKITDCVVDADAGSYVTATYEETDLEGDNAGGLIGFMGEGTTLYIDDCSANIDVTGTRKVGGLVGYLHYGNTLSDSYATGDVTSNASASYVSDNTITIGGLAGELSSTDTDAKPAPVITNSYATGTVIGKSETTTGQLHGGKRTSPITAAVHDLDKTINALYSVTTNNDGDYVVIKPVVVATLNGDDYYTIDDAIAAADDGDTIHLNEDTEVTTLIVPAGVTLNIAEDVTLETTGTITNNGIILNYGTISNGDKLTTSGVLANYGSITGVTSGGVSTVSEDTELWSLNAAESYSIAVDTGNKIVTINTAEELALFGNEVSGASGSEVSVNYSDYTIKITKDIDLDGKVWTPIYSKGTLAGATIDGDSHIIENMDAIGYTYYSGSYYGGGFIGDCTGAITIQNITFDNAFTSMFEDPIHKGNIIGTVMGYTYGATIYDNVHVLDSVVWGFGKVGGILGMSAQAGNSVTFKDTSVEDTDIYADYNVGGFAGNIQRGADEDPAVITNSYVYNNTFYDDGNIYELEGNYNGTYWLYNGGTSLYGGFGDFYVSYGSGDVDFEGTGNGSELTGKTVKNSEIPVDAVAAIDGKMYPTLEAAIAAAKDGDTITIYEDVALTSAVKVESDITIMGATGSETISAAYSTSENNGLFVVNDDVTATFKDLTFTVDNFGITTEALDATATITVDGCTFNSDGSANSAVSGDWSTGESNHYSLTFTNNVVTGAFNKPLHIILSKNDTLVVNNNQFNGTAADNNNRSLTIIVQDTSATVSITNNTFSKLYKAISVDNSTATGTWTITGNSFIDCIYDFDLSTINTFNTGYSLAYNYFDGALPVILDSGNDSKYSNSDNTSNLVFYPYYSDADLTILVYDDEGTTQNVTEVAIEALGDLDIDPEELTEEQIDAITLAAYLVASADTDALLEEGMLDEINALDALFDAANDNISVDTDLTELEDETYTIEKVEVAGLAIAAYGNAVPADDIDLILDVKQEESADGVDLAFTAKPYVSINDGTPTKIDNDDLNAPVTFLVYLPDTFEYDYAEVEHVKSDDTSEFMTLSVLEDENGSYIQITVTEFSTFYVTGTTVSTSTSVRNTYYDIDVEDTENGEVTVSLTRAVEGKTITITATPDDGYEIDEVIVLDEGDDEIDVDDEGDGEYTFEMPDEDVTIEVTFVAIDEDEDDDTIAFLDVDTDAYYYDAVLWAVEEGITNGMTEYLFAPDTVCTRAQAVTFLWNAAGNPTVFIENPFADVAEDAWYYEAVLWAVSEGITSGTTETTFAPDSTCTRAQIVTFLWNAAGNSVVDDEMDFADVAADSWYAEAVRWAVAEGITTGMTATEFAPATNCTRGQIVTFLYRYLGE